MHSIHLSEQSLEAMARFTEFDHQGRVFTEQGGLNPTSELEMLERELGDAFGADIARHAYSTDFPGFSQDAISAERHGDTRLTIGYRNSLGKIIFSVALADGWCGIGIYDLDEGTCSYGGVTAC